MMKTVWERASETEKPILLYGTGNGADKILDELQRLSVKVSGVFASDGFVRKREFRGFPVISYSQAKEKFGDFLVLTAFGSSRKDVIDNILMISKERELYSADVPVYGDEIFNRAFYEKHIDEINEVRDMLCDELSKKVFDNTVKFKLTGNVDLLLACQTEKDEAYKNVLRLGNNEIYMDLGAYDGDTIREFLNHTGGYEKIYAVEPNGRNFKKLCKNTSELKNTELFNICVSDKTDYELLPKNGGRSILGKANQRAESDTVDNILNGKRVTYIKFDVEGFESKAIDGTAETIKNYKPKMLVSCYHRSEDIFALALKVKKIRPDYKVYIRHNPYIPAWDTQFYFI